eukprot:TRINITY_DN1031_c0_g1_i1.p1 TRINITY_DN1031_c0_g1~~TRINITY_DN1031_c0_g1_i1.p1  ORF type:complete len:938 (+),score=189.16 TRINITY_DN1031_c0_g1_i1:209-3022(+)
MEPEQAPSSPALNGDGSGGSLSARLRLDSQWLIDYDELITQDRISEGTTAKVYQGEYRGQEVAIKILNSDLINVEKLQQEFMMISAIRSPHVVVFYGLSIEPKLALVMEYCARGTLDEVLGAHNDDEVIDWTRFFQLAKGLASAINVLHRWKPQIIHREIRPQNILMTDDWQVKFCDFGRARYNERGDEALKSQTLDSGIENAAYTAPEIYTDGTYSPKTDVYSVGITLWEIASRILTGKHTRPFSDLLSQGLNSFQILRKTCTQGLRPPIPENMPPALTKLLQATWDQEPEKRPTASDLTKELQNLLNVWKKEKSQWKVVVPADDGDDDAAEDVATPRSTRPQQEPAAAALSQSVEEKAKEEKMRLEIENQVQQRLEEEKKKIEKEFSTTIPSSTGVAEIDPKEVILVGEPIGRGQFGEVWRGTLHGKDVAVKKLFVGDDLEEDVLRDFRREVEVMITLRHPNICLLMGACTQPGNLMIIMEFLSNGSVYDLCHGKRKRNMSFEQRIKMAKDCALGMNWLHHMNPPFLHLDLKPHNLLVDANLNVKVADFGLSQMKGKESDDLGGSPFYMAPEVLLGRGASEKSDVYSFAIVLWQLVSLQEPYKGMFADEEELIMSVCDDQIRPEIPEGTSTGCANLIKACWADNPDDRPSFKDILEQRLFEKILIESEISDPSAAAFWGEFFCTERRPSWLEFWACLVRHLQPKEVPSERDPKLELFKLALLDGDGKDPDGPKISRDNFNKFVAYYGPFELPGMIDRLQIMVKCPYFHGDLSKKAALNQLAKTKKTGMFLVRYGTNAGDFIISVYSKQKHGCVENFIVTILHATGQYILLVAPPGTSLNMNDPDHRVIFQNPAFNAKIPSFPTLDALIQHHRKQLSIAKMNKFVPYKQATPPVRMPAEEVKKKDVGTIRGGSSSLLSDATGKPSENKKSKKHKKK